MESYSYHFPEPQFPRPQHDRMANGLTFCALLVMWQSIIPNVSASLYFIPCCCCPVLCWPLWSKLHVRSLLLDDFRLQETEFPAKRNSKIRDLLSHLIGLEAGWYQGCLTQWLDQVQVLEFSWLSPHGHKVAAPVPSITSTYNNSQNQEEMNF